jgi:hypothetical protein
LTGNLFETQIAYLERDENDLLKLSMNCLNAGDGALLPLDLMASAAVKRTLAQAAGFRNMVESKNMICAGSILRLQLDTALRFFAAYLVCDPHGFAKDVMSGVHVRKLKDRNGKRMTDAYLVEQLSRESEEYEWVTRVYDRTSGYVHFSRTHMFSIYKQVESSDGSVEIELGATDVDLLDSIYLEAIDSFIASVRIFMEYLKKWGIAKQDPRVAEQLWPAQLRRS